MKRAWIAVPVIAALLSAGQVNADFDINRVQEELRRHEEELQRRERGSAQQEIVITRLPKTKKKVSERVVDEPDFSAKPTAPAPAPKPVPAPASMPQPAEMPKDFQVSGYIKNLNVFTQSSGTKPETAYNALDREKHNANLFASTNRARIKMQWEMNEIERRLDAMKMDLKATVEYDNQLVGGSYVNRGDFRIARDIAHEKQAADLGVSIVDESGIFYENSLYRAHVAMRTDVADVTVGRQLIPWGVGKFVTPTDVFNPYSFSRIELDERDGVDAVNISTDVIPDYNVNFVYTPRGGRLHPNRYMTRVSRDIHGFETGIVGGRVGENEVIGYDIEGNVGDAVVRSEMLYEDAEDEDNFARFIVNADYNFSNGIYAMAEYHYNSRGKSDPAEYETARVILGEIDLMGQNYLGLHFGYDLSPLTRIENTTMMNLEDASAFNRLELSHSLKENLTLNLAAILMAGSSGDEFGDKQNVYFTELQWFF